MKLTYCIPLLALIFSMHTHAQQKATTTVPLKVAAYNIKMDSKDIQPVERAQHIPAYLKDYDAVIFSEAFADKGRRPLLHALQAAGFNYASCVLGSGYADATLIKRHRNKAYKQPYIIDFNHSRFGKKNDAYGQGGSGSTTLYPNGGVIIVSKYPIKKAYEWIYDRPLDIKIDKGIRWSRQLKGVVYVAIEKDGMLFHIFGTHTQARYSKGSQKTIDTYHKIISNQMKQLGAFIESFKIPTTEAVILGGDFNINKYATNPEDPKNQLVTIKAMVKNTNALIPELKNPVPPYNDFGSTVAHPARKPKYKSQIDYVFVDKKYKNPVSMTSQYVAIETPQPLGNGIDFKSLSDHSLVETTFIFTKE